MNLYYYNHPNVGDALSPVIVHHFWGRKPRRVSPNISPKLLAVGSIMKTLREGDTVWGSGVIRETDTWGDLPSECKFLALRGKLSEENLGVNVGVYGDPALLLPLMYNPQVKIKHEVGYIPHYVDAPTFDGSGKKVIRVTQDWKSFVREVKSCKKIVSSSLHGIIIAEAYGIPAQWAVYSNKVIGNGFKFKDYLTGTNRPIQEPGDFPPIPNLKELQEGLLRVIPR